jgi:phage recombination protein Bet
MTDTVTQVDQPTGEVKRVDGTVADESIEYVVPGRPDKIKLSYAIVRRFFCPKAEFQDAMAFIGFCRANALDPFNREAYLMLASEEDEDGARSKRAQIIVAYSTFMKKADQHADYDGFEAGLLVKLKNADADFPFRNRLPEDVSPPYVAIAGSFVPEGSDLVGAWCLVWRKNRSHASPVILPLDEYLRRKKGGDVQRMWTPGVRGGKQSHMMRKTALAHGHREAYPDLGGFHLAEEFQRSEDALALEIRNGGQESRIQESRQLTGENPGRFESLRVAAGWGRGQLEMVVAEQRRAGKNEDEIAAFIKTASLNKGHDAVEPEKVQMPETNGYTSF